MQTHKSKIDEVMEKYDRLHNIPINITDTVTHSEFVAGTQNQTVTFAVLGGEPIRLASGGAKAFFTVLVQLYLVAPMLVVPFWAYHERNWWLLFGIVASLIASQLAQLKGNSIGGVFLLANLIFLFTRGLHSYYTFFSFCALWSYMFFQIADAVQTVCARQALLDRPELFSREVAEKGILIWRRRDAPVPASTAS